MVKHFKTIVEKTFETIEANKEKYIDFICKICSFEARAYDKATIDSMADYISDFAKSEGLSVKRKSMEKCGDFLTIEINAGAEKAALLMAHMDTVFDKGEFGEIPVRVDGDRIFGPGVIDCKGGIAIAILTMKSLLEHGFQKHVRLILTSDEEISNILGGAEEISFIQESAKGFPAAINCETAENDEVVVGRKGIIKYKLDIKGVGGHSGKQYFTSKNAILEAAHKTVALHGKSVVGGTTYSCNLIRGGNALNVIPDNCSLSLDIRAVTVEDMKKAMEEVEHIANNAYVPGTSCEATLISTRPPMEKTEETIALFEKLLSVCHTYKLGSLTPKETGGGSDSSYTQAAGIPSICGMGASGALQHTTKEFLNVDSIPLRAKILVGYFWS